MNQDSLSNLIARPFRFFISQQPRVFFIGLAALFLTDLFDALYPLALKVLIDLVAAGRTGTALLKATGVFFAIMVSTSVFRYIWRAYFGQFQHGVAEDLRNRIFHKFTSLGASFFQKHPVGELMSLISNDVHTFRMAAGPGVLVLLDGIFISASVLPIMISLSWDWTWKTLIFLPLLPFFISRMERLIHRRYKLQQDRFSEMSGSTQELVSGIRVIKSYAQEEGQTKNFNKYSRLYEQACNRTAFIDAVFDPAMQFTVATGSVILLWLGSPQVIRAAMSLGTFYAFHRYIQKMMWPMTAVGAGVTMIQQGRASMDRIAQLLQEPLDLPDNGKVEIDRFEKLEVRNLSFTYPGSSQPTLKNISFELHHGETIGIVGAVGAGKSTLVQLLCRLYPVPEDKIFINGIEIHQISQKSLRELFALVPQDAFLFSENIIDNISLGLPATASLEETRHFAQVVNIDAEIEELPARYETYLGERGVNVSGGQKQRLTIARALIRNAPVVIFDDSLSAVDSQTENKILNQIHHTLTLNRTAIIISHRLGTLSEAHRIIVLKDGQVEAIGSARDLISRSATYRELHRLQNQKEASL